MYNNQFNTDQHQEESSGDVLRDKVLEQKERIKNISIS